MVANINNNQSISPPSSYSSINPGKGKPISEEIKNKIPINKSSNSSVPLKEKKWTKCLRFVMQLVTKVVNFIRKLFGCNPTISSQNTRNVNFPTQENHEEKIIPQKKDKDKDTKVKKTEPEKPEPKNDKGIKPQVKQTNVKNDEKEIDSNTAVTGITNPGSSCYINSTNQCIFHLPSLKNMFEKAIEKLPEETDINFEERQKIVKCHKKLYKSYQKNQTKDILRLSNRLRKLMFETDLGIACGFAGSKTAQNDAERVTRFLLTAYGIKFHEIFQDEVTLPNSEEKLQCSPNQNDLFVLPVSLSEKVESIQDVVNNTFSLEKHQDDQSNMRTIELETGEKITSPNWTRKSNLSALPDMLPIQIKRFKHNTANNRVEKVRNPINIGNGTIDLAVAIDSPDPILYKLKGAIVHSGGVSGGHYVAYFKEGEEFYYASDETVRRLKSEVEFYERCKDSYVLFYEKVD